MAEEIDLISIIKTLRRARFLINQRMDWKQQQLVDYFKEYSLETPTIHNKDRKLYTKKELIKYITTEPIGKTDDYLMFHKQIQKRIIYGKAKAIHYIDEKNTLVSSSSDDDAKHEPQENSALKRNELVGLFPQFPEQSNLFETDA